MKTTPVLCSSSLCKLAPCILTIKTLNHKPLKTSSSWWYSSCLVYKYTELSSVRNHRLSVYLLITHPPYKSYASLWLSMSTTKLTAKKSSQERLLSQERKDSERFPVTNGICLAYLSRRASRNSHEKPGETLLDEAAIVSATGKKRSIFVCVTVEP